MPKLEYQAYYGVEALTESEVCQLWTERMLHSECLFYIGKFHVLIFALEMCVSEYSQSNRREKLLKVYSILPYLF